MLERAAPLDRQMQRNCRLDRLGSAGRGAGSRTSRAAPGAVAAGAQRFLEPSHTAEYELIQARDPKVFHRRRAMCTDASNKTTTVTHIRHNPQYMYCHKDCRAT